MNIDDKILLIETIVSNDFLLNNIIRDGSILQKPSLIKSILISFFAPAS